MHLIPMEGLSMSCCLQLFEDRGRKEGMGDGQAAEQVLRGPSSISLQELDL